jgi:SAM-dependent methyltransferase
MTEKSAEYVLGTTKEELERLGFQHSVWHPEAEKLWQLGGFSTGQSLLDLGCGPGFATLDLAGITGPGGHVHAVDAAPNYIDYLGSKLAEHDIHHVTLEVGDVTALKIDDASVDGIFARWLFCFLPEPEAALAEAFRVMRPGATVVIWDYFNYLSARFFPSRNSLNGMFSAFEKSNSARGGTYNIGGMLPTLLLEQGFELVALEPMCKTIRPGTPHWQWFVLFKDSFTPGLVDGGFLSEAEYQQINADFSEIEQLPETFWFPPPQIGVVARKPQ